MAMHHVIRRLASGAAPVLFAGLGLALAAGLSGCASSGSSDSFSESSGSISDSISSPFKSSSDSSGGDSAYRRDLETVILALLDESPQSGDAWSRAVSRVARSHGISDWERSPRTLAGLGAGLRQGGLDELAARDWLRALLGGADAEREAWLLDGYRGAEPVS